MTFTFMFHRNFLILFFSQILSFTAAPITIFLSGIIGTNMIEDKSFSTLPTALMIVGTALGSIFASYIMSIKGRKFGFMLATIITSGSALFASYAVYENLFLIYCISNFLIGIGHAFVAQYRFAAAESVKRELVPTSISIILFASMIGALIGPNIASLTKNIIPNVIYSGSYVFLSILTITPFFFFMFYKNEKVISITNIANYDGRTYLKIFLQPKFIQAVVTSGLAYCIMSFLMTATPISMHIHNHISLGKTGFVIMFHILAMFLPSLITGNLIKKYGHNNIMYIGVFFLFVSILTNFIDQTLINYFIGLILLGLGWNFLFISGTSLLITSYKPEEKFRAQGMNDFIVFTTQAIGALSAGLLLSFFGWKLINLLCIPLLIIIFFTIFILNKRYELITKRLNL